MDPYHDQSVSVYWMELPKEIDPTQPVTVQIRVPAPLFLQEVKDRCLDPSGRLTIMGWYLKRTLERAGGVTHEAPQ